MSEEMKLLQMIGVADFTVQEFALYLDTHPEDKRAREYFDHYAKLRNEMEREFSAKYYPLTLTQSNNEKKWEWGSAPLPWEGAGC